MSLVNDITSVKKAVADNWDDILTTADQLEKLISDGLLWLEDEGNIQKINSTLINIQIPTFSASNPIPTGIFDSTLSVLQQKIDPLLSDLQTLEQEITPSSILDSIESHLPDMPDLPGIPGLDIATVKRVLNAILDDGFSISLNELPYNSNNSITNSNIATSPIGSNVLPSTNPNLKTDTVNEIFSNGITGVIQNYYNKNKANIDTLFEGFESLLTDNDLSDFEQILSSTTSSYLTSDQPITSSILIDLMGQVLQNTSDKAKTISQLLTNQFSSDLVTLKTILTDLLNTQIDTESELYALYTEIKPSQTTPTLLQIISLSLSIPVTLISKAVSGENLTFNKSLFQENEAENNGTITAEGIFCIINAITSVANFIFEQKCESNDNSLLSSSRGDVMFWGTDDDVWLSRFGKIVFFSTISKLIETAIMTPEVREETSDADNATQTVVYVFKFLDLLSSARISIATFNKFSKDVALTNDIYFYYIVNKGKTKKSYLMERYKPSSLAVPIAGSTEPIFKIMEDAITYYWDNGFGSFSSYLEEVKKKYTVFRVVTLAGVLAPNLAAFIIQNKNRIEGEAFDPRVRINFLLDPTAIFIDIFSDILEYFIEPKLTSHPNALQKLKTFAGVCTYGAAFIDFPIAALYFDVLKNPFPGTPIITQNGNQLSVSFKNAKGKYQDINDSDTKIQWQNFNNNSWSDIPNAKDQIYTVTNTNPIRVSVYYNLNFFDNKLYAYYPRIIRTTIVNNVLTVTFDTIIQANQGSIGRGSFSIQSNTTPAATNLPTIADPTKDDSSGKTVFTIPLNPTPTPQAGNYKIVPAENALKDSNNNIVSTDQANNTFTI
jgi:hypothetical protein